MQCRKKSQNFGSILPAQQKLLTLNHCLAEHESGKHQHNSAYGKHECFDHQKGLKSFQNTCVQERINNSTEKAAYFNTGLLDHRIIE